MSYSKEFQDELNEMFRIRTALLRNLFYANSGNKHIISRQFISDKIEILKEIASDKFTHEYFKAAFTNDIAYYKCWKVEGRGYKEKIELFKSWYNKHFLGLNRLIYIFWDLNNRCIYVGRTGKGGARPINHFIKVWFPAVRKVEIYVAKNIGKIPKLECLAMHKYKPSKNLKRSAKQHKTQACPMCEMHRKIEKEIRHIFSIRK